MVALVAGWPWAKREPAPVIVRQPVEPFARQFVYFFAIVPALAATFTAVLIGWTGPIGGVGPLIILSGLAVVVAAGDNIEFSHQHVVISAWFGLLFVPPIMAAVAVLTLPWIGVDIAINQPARAMAQFFDDSYRRRMNAPLPIVAGDPRLAALIAAGASSRPSLFLDATPERTPWVTMDDVRKKGAIIVWQSPDTAGAPPPELKVRFPEIVPEVPPRAFARPVQGQLPLMRIGWAVIRPRSPDAPPAPGTTGTSPSR
jgi:hypothetical protein